jgi:ACT domain-containing protein
MLVLAGKDYFDADHAAEYCNLSRAQFYKVRDAVGLRPFTFGGKKLYRRADIQRLIEDAAKESYGNPIRAQG